MTTRRNPLRRIVARTPVTFTKSPGYNPTYYLGHAFLWTPGHSAFGMRRFADSARPTPIVAERRD
jgi:hypothetical protein